MATGHMNPGYQGIVTRFKSATLNPSGKRLPLVIDKNELENIKAQAKSAWSVKDTSQTTYGFYHCDPLIKEKASLRPVSPTRRNNPHPKKVFLTTRLKDLPGYFNSKEERELQSHSFKENVDINQELEVFQQPKQLVRPKTVSVYSNVKRYLHTLQPEQAEIEENVLKKAGINTDIDPNANSDRVYNYGVTNNLENCSNLSSFVESQDRIVSERAYNRNKLQTNMLNPYLYNDIRMYKEKYASKNHGLPNEYARKPFRGDFFIHPDWHTGLKHHRLPYLY